MNKKASFDLYLIFMISVIFIIILAFFIIPFAINLHSMSLSTSNKIFSYAQDDINNIQDENVKEALSETYQEAINYNSDSSIILTQFFKYSWVLIILITGIILFMIARQRSEYLKGGVV